MRVFSGDVDELVGLLHVLVVLLAGHLLGDPVLEHLELLLPPERQIVNLPGQIINEVVPLRLLPLPMLIQYKRQQNMVLPVVVHLLGEVLGVLLEE